jgi:hypothetical protein
MRHRGKASICAVTANRNLLLSAILEGSEEWHCIAHIHHLRGLTRDRRFVSSLGGPATMKEERTEHISEVSLSTLEVHAI